MNPPNQVLGLSAGEAGGSAEILLSTALQAAREAGADARLVRLVDLDLDDDTDLWWLWERLV